MQMVCDVLYQRFMIGDDIVCHYLLLVQDMVHASARDAIIGGAEGVFSGERKRFVVVGAVVVYLHVGYSFVTSGIDIESESEAGYLLELTIQSWRIGRSGKKKF